MSKIYVGTYGKYAAGSIDGAWLDCEDYSTAAEFIDACRALHAGEPDPELMFQDFEGFPRAFYAESSIDPRIWEWIDLDDSDREIWQAYLEDCDDSADFETARDCYAGSADSEADFAEQYLDDTGGLESIPENLRCYFDYAAYARDMRLGGDFTFCRADNGGLGQLHVFYNR